jgi:hypothetical protein
VSARFLSEFFELARDVRARADNRVVDEKLIQQVLAWLADYRAEHNLH